MRGRMLGQGLHPPRRREPDPVAPQFLRRAALRAGAHPPQHSQRSGGGEPGRDRLNASAPPSAPVHLIDALSELIDEIERLANPLATGTIVKSLVIELQLTLEAGDIFRRSSYPIIHCVHLSRRSRLSGIGTSPRRDPAACGPWRGCLPSASRD